MDQISVDQALLNLHNIAEAAAMNGRDRDIARASVQSLSALIAAQAKPVASPIVEAQPLPEPA